MNILHVCRPHNMLELLLDYPVAAVNWAVHAPGNISLAEGLAKTARLSSPETGLTVMGGIDERHTLLDGSPEEVRAEVEDALRQTGSRRFLLAPSCSVSPQTPAANLHAAVEAARDAST